MYVLYINANLSIMVGNSAPPRGGLFKKTFETNIYVAVNCDVTLSLYDNKYILSVSIWTLLLRVHEEWLRKNLLQLCL